MIVAFDVLWMGGAIFAWGPPGLAAGMVLHGASKWFGWPAAAAALPVAYLVFLTVLVITVGGFARLLPKPKPGTCKVFADANFFLFLIHWGLERYVPRPLITHIQLLTGLRTLYFRLLGARLGWSTHLSPGCQIWGPALVHLGHLTYIGDYAHIASHLSQGDKLVMAPVVFGDRCNVGAHSNIGPGCTFGSDVRVGALTDIAPGCWLEDEVELGPRCQLGMGVKVGKGSRVEPRTFLDSWTTVPSGELWGGDPGRKIGELRDTPGARRRRRRRLGGAT